MSLRTYLQQHFVDKPMFASLVGIPTNHLDELIAAQAIPSATYTCDQNTVHSAAFGVMECKEPLVGEYFRPQCVRWAKIAAQAPRGSERAAVLTELTAELRAALGDYCGEDADALESRIRGYIPHFCNGTFGLCVADPSSGAGIARKEMLQERLARLTENGSNPSPSGISRQELLRLIDDYAASAMPFSPAEYQRSSRKRLVDDLRPIAAKA